MGSREKRPNIMAENKRESSSAFRRPALQGQIPVAVKIRLDHMFDHLAKQNRIEQPKSSLSRIFRQMRACSICIRLRPPSPKSIEKSLLLDTLRIRYNLPSKSCLIRSCLANGFCPVFMCLE